MQIPLSSEENEKNVLSYSTVIFKFGQITENHQKCEYNLKRSWSILGMLE